MQEYKVMRAHLNIYEKTLLATYIRFFKFFVWYSGFPRKFIDSLELLCFFSFSLYWIN